MLRLNIKTVRKLAFLILGALSGYLLFIPHVTISVSKLHLESGIPYSIGTKDDPQARAMQEFMMLRDPATNKIPDNIFYLEREFAKNLPKRVEKSFNKKSELNETSALTWTARGPNNVGGRTRALGIDIQTGTPPNVTILAGGVSGGIWRSTNDGSTWTSVTSPSQLHSVTSLTQDKRSGEEDIWYAGTGELVGNSASGSNASTFMGDGIFKSTDNGITWSIISSTATNKPQSFDQAFDYVHNIAVSPTTGSVFAAASNTIQRSTDGGTNWSTVRGSLANNSFTDVQTTSTGVVYATLNSGVTNPGIWQSTDDGNNWTDITPGGFPSTYVRIVIGIAPSNEDIVYFLGETTGGTTTLGHSLWKYNASTNSWSDRSANIPAFGGAVSDFTSQGSYDLAIKIKPNDPDFVIIGGTNLYRSTDGFSTSGATTWIGGYSPANDVSQYPNHHPDQHAIVFLPGSNIITYSGHDGGVSKTNDITTSFGGNVPVVWTSLNNSYHTTQFYSISLAPESGSNVMMGGMQDNGTWLGDAAGSSDWTFMESGDGTIVEVAPFADDLIYTAYQLGGLRRRDRAGNNMVEFDPLFANNQLFVNPILLDPNSSSIMYYAGGTNSSNTGIWRSNPQTATGLIGWTNLSSTIVNGDQLSALGISISNSLNVLYYGTENGIVKRVDNANTGSAPTVTNISSGLPSSGYVSSIAVDPTNSNNAIVTFSNYSFQSLWYTTNGGSSWTDIEGNLSGATGPSVRWATIFYVSGTPHYFLGTSIGVYYTITLNGTSTVWTQEAVNSIGNTVTVMLDWRDADGILAAATHGMGVYTTTISTPLPVEISSFTGMFQDNKVKLLWRTETEINNYGFEIERNSSPEEIGWKNIGFVEGYGNSNSPKSYEFLDKNIAGGKLYYRLKQIDNDGTYEYSDMVEINVPIVQKYAILEQNYPNPFNPETKIRFVVNENTQASVILYDAVGSKIVELFDNDVEAGKIYEINFDGSLLSSGVYYYSLITSKQRETRKMLLLK